MAVLDVICGAIAERRLLSFTYKGEARIAEPFILGYDEHDDLVLSAVQTAGGSGVGFRTFPIEGVTSLKVMDQKFSGFRPQYNPRDRFFARIICQV
jgi:hypothetical protein